MITEKEMYDIEDQVMYLYVLKNWHPALKVTRYHLLTRQDLRDLGIQVQLIGNKLNVTFTV